MSRIVLLSLGLITGSVCQAAPIKVFILAGQSNAIGGQFTSQLPPEFVDPQSARFQYKLQTGTFTESANWESLRALPPVLGGWGTELSFARAMEQRTGAPIAIIKTGVNGSNLWEQWLPTSNNLYPWMLTKVNSSLSQLTALGYEPDVSGFLWIQGEGDANVQVNALAYDDNLALLASQLRTDLAIPDLPFLLNEAHVNLSRQFVNDLRQSQRNAAAADPNMFIVNADDLMLGGDEVHWTPGMHLEMGRRFADLVLPSGDFNDDGSVDGADLPIWRSAVGSNRSGDGTADGVSDGQDFLMWQRQIGTPATTPSAAAIPEPSSAWLLAFYSLMATPRVRSIFARGE
jgi:Carbohydrate esterase, sialic acid-specific acetylesterase